MRWTGWLTGLVFLANGALAQAAERQPGRHQHGQGILNVALENGFVDMELQVPAQDLAGFESAPGTEAEKTRLREAAALLRQPEVLFGFPEAAGCSVQDVTVEAPFLKGRKPGSGHDGHKDHHDDEGQEKKQTGDSRNEAHQDGHANEHTTRHDDEAQENGHKGHHDDEGHAGFLARYRFSCEDPNQLSSLRFPYFARVPGTEKLEVTVLGEEQKRYDVSRDAAFLRLD